MCGIWVSVGFEAPSQTLEVISHRGPDGGKSERFDTKRGPLVLAHRRLSIIDLDERAGQPMSHDDGRYWLVYNGEIYNYIELRSELEKLGRSFRTQSDSEVLLAAYAQWGPACLERFNGMFAFVLLDRRKNCLFIARDRFGIKPLYVWAVPGKIAFASEIKQFLEAPGFHPRADPDAIHDFLRFGVTDHGYRSFFSGVVEFPAGHCSILDLAQPLPNAATRLKSRRWYRLPEGQGLSQLSLAQLAGKLRRTLEEAVRLRMRADVPVGTSLSGGLDSSIIVGLLARQERTSSQHCVSAVFPAFPEIDESPYIDAIQGQYPRLKIHRVQPDAEDFKAILSDIVWHQDMPFATTSILAQWSVFACARKAGLKVMLDGQGADELFGGYYLQIGAYLAGMVARLRLFSCLANMRMLKRHSGYGYARQLQWMAAAALPPGLAADLRALYRRTGVSHWLREKSRHYALPLKNHADLARGGLRGGLAGMCRSMLLSTSLPMLLRFADRSSMAHGVEVRLPYLDVRLVELALALDENLKINQGESKWIQRRAFEHVLREKIRRRHDKIGFASPEARWMRGPLKEAAMEGVRMACDYYPELFDERKTLKGAKAILDGERPWDGMVWRVWCLALWTRRFGMR